jgi:hypothetical protein
MSQPDNAEQWNLRYLISEAIRTGAKLSLDDKGNILVDGAYSGPPLLVEQNTPSRVATDGKRRGFNGKQPRTSDGVQHPCTVTTADGRRYEFTTRTTKSDADLTVGRRKDGSVFIRTTLADLDPSNDRNPDA